MSPREFTTNTEDNMGEEYMRKLQSTIMKYLSVTLDWRGRTSNDTLGTSLETVYNATRTLVVIKGVCVEYRYTSPLLMNPQVTEDGCWTNCAFTSTTPPLLCKSTFCTSTTTTQSDGSLSY